MTKAKKKDLQDTFQIEVDGEKREIFMSYGLLNMLATYVQDVENLLQIGLDPITHANVALVLLAPRDKRNRPQLVSKNEDGEEVAFDLFEVSVSRDDVNDLVDWAGDHLSDFFMKGMRQSMKRAESQKDLMREMSEKTKELESLTTGLPNSPSLKSAAGPST